MGVRFLTMIATCWMTGQAIAQPIARSCTRLSSVALPETTITIAESVAAGVFVPPAPFTAAGPRGALPIVAARDFPEFCRVSGTIKLNKDSEINFEVWLPTSNWNGKLMGMGNGGFAGSIFYQVMGAPLARGYAVAATDRGHNGGPFDASFALGHPEKLIDFAYRATHETTVKAKQILRAFYGRLPDFSYWSGCSGGGEQGLSEAQRYPTDYDGIIAGAAPVTLPHLVSAAMWRNRALDETPVPPAKIALLHQAVLTACDALDGIRDGVLEDPRRCDFDPRRLQCKDGDGPDCLTAAEVRVVQRFYSPLLNPRTHTLIFPGLERGSELLWVDPASIARRTNFGSGDWLQFAIFQDPKWDPKAFDFDSGLARADQLDNGLMTRNRSLHDFLERGGKLLQYHGWSDPGISPRSALDYYESVRSVLGGAQTDGSYRLFMVPGMGHCFGGEGPTTFDPVSAIEQWVERGSAPDRIVASRLTGGKVDRTRPLCPYPQVAQYKGVGSTDDAENFVCQAP